MGEASCLAAFSARAKFTLRRFVGSRRITMRVVFLAAILGSAITHPANAQPSTKSAPVSAGLTDTSRSLHAKVRSVGLADVQWTDGFWADRLTICRSSMIPEMGRI